MASDNTQLNPGTGGDTIRDVLKGTAKTQVVTLDLGGAGAEQLIAGSMPVTGTFWQATQNTSSNAIVDAGNSSTTPLGISGNFTGSAIDLLNYSTLRISLFADQPSATNGLKVQFSSDGTNWDITRQATYLDSGIGETIVFNRVSRYARVNYTNTNVAQTVFRIQTLLSPNSAEYVRHFMGESPSDSDTGIMTQSVLVGKTTAGGGSYVNVKVNPSGALTTATTAADGDVYVRSTTAANFNATSYQGGTWNIGTVSSITNPVAVTGTFWQSTQPVSIASTVATSEVAPTTVAHAAVTVTTAGTRVQFAANTAKSIVVKAASANTGIIYVGGSGVTSANGFPLAAGDTVSLDINNTNVVWVDASINAQSCNWMSNN